MDVWLRLPGSASSSQKGQFLHRNDLLVPLMLALHAVYLIYERRFGNTRSCLKSKKFSELFQSKIIVKKQIADLKYFFLSYFSCSLSSLKLIVQ